ncbi:MAG: hypothetical protein E4H36_14715 [Spirochaetales bacterium]|nr:MAG: hypothetical protein E4H36_14715 [Spirochaetales bacterium]
MKEKHGTRLAYAEGFDGSSLPGDLAVTGSAYPSWDKVILEPKTSISLPALTVNREALLMEIETEYLDGGEGEIVIGFPQTDINPVVITSKGFIIFSDGRKEVFKAPDRVSAFQVSKTEKSLEIIWANGISVIPLVKESLELSLTIRHTGEKGSVNVDRILILTKNLNLAKENAPPPAEEIKT